MNAAKLWKIRKEIKLNSLYISDYENSFGYDPFLVSQFFDGYLEHLENLMQENIPSFDDSRFFDYLPEYDNRDNLMDYYNSLESECINSLFVKRGKA